MEGLPITQRIKQELDKLLLKSSYYATERVPVHEMETGLLSQLLALGHAILLDAITSRIETSWDAKVESGPDELIERKGTEPRRYLSMFGMMDFSRPSYWSEKRGKFHVLDELLELPKNSRWSYNLQGLIGENASENDYRESIRVVDKLLGLGLSGKSSERNASNLGTKVDAFYDALPVVVEGAPVFFSASFDGKGVPKVKKKVVETGENPKKRLGKGEKRNVMQMATVSVTSSFTPKESSRESIIRGLMDSPLSKVGKDGTIAANRPENDNRWHKGIHRRAFLADQQKAVDYGIRNIRDRMTHPDSRFVVPIDAGIGLEAKVLASVEKYGISGQFDGIILDIIHVSEYAWDAGTAIFGEKSKLKAPWVKGILEDLLDSKTGKVIEDLQKIVEKSNLSKSKLKQVNKTITYFKNHQHNMDYKKFIEKGYPVSSALVESACGHLVKERMEQTGMRWESTGAQNIMDLRAVKLNDHMDQFIQFIIKGERMKNFKLAA
jgi:hypothetical protein